MDKFNGTQNPLEFLQIYTTAIRATGGDENVMANYLPTVLEGSARSWLLKLPVGSVYTWEQLCDLLIANFQGTYDRPGKEDDLHRIRQKSNRQVEQPRPGRPFKYRG